MSTNAYIPISDLNSDNYMSGDPQPAYDLAYGKFVSTPSATQASRANEKGAEAEEKKLDPVEI